MGKNNPIFTTVAICLLTIVLSTVNALAQFNEVAKILASDKQAGDGFGWSVSISGDRAIVGTPWEDTGGVSAGTAYIFERNGAGGWSEAVKIQAGDKQAGDLFGYSVSIDGDRAIVGAHQTDTGGGAYIFERSGTGAWSEVAKIQASDNQTGDFFGQSVAISGDRAIVGEYGEDIGAFNAGAAYIFERDGSGIWSETAKIQASDKQASDLFGVSVSISGDHAIIGAYREDTGGSNVGAAYIFERNTNGVWSETAKIQASNKQADMKFGISVAINGGHAIVGADQEDAGGISVGAAYIFERNTDGFWSEVAKIQAGDKEDGDLFGNSVSISGDRAIVGMRGNHPGAAYIFERNTNGVWSETAKIQASNKQVAMKFGYSVAISGGQAIVGAYQEETGGTSAGTAYIFEYSNFNQPPIADAGADQEICSGSSTNIGGSPTGSGGDGEPYTFSWSPATGLSSATAANPTAAPAVTTTYTVTVTDENGGEATDDVTVTVLSNADAAEAQFIEVAKIQASDIGTGDDFGYSVSISGDRAIVGAYGEDTGGSSAGAAYIFERNGAGGWSEVTKIQARDKEAYDYFGYSVSISGDRAIVGANREDTNAGAAYIFERSGAGIWSEIVKIQASDKEAGDYFGWSVSISGDRAIVGAYREGTGGNHTGTAYIFERSAAGFWSEAAKIQASDKEARDEFGFSVSISGDRAIVGAYDEDTGGRGAGAAYIFERSPDGSGWSETVKIQASDKERSDEFGSSVSISGDRAIVGAYKEDTGVNNAGAAYIFERCNAGGWSEIAKIQASDKGDGGGFGWSVSISGDRIIVGTDVKKPAYIFEPVTNQPPVAHAGADQEICTSASLASVTLDGSGSNDPEDDALTYTWKKGATTIATGGNPTVSLGVGSHTIEITVEDGNGGSDTDEVVIDVFASPSAVAGADAEIFEGATVVIGGAPTASGGTGALATSWSPADGLDDASAANPTAEPAVTTTYTVTVTDENGCEATDDVTVTVLSNAEVANNQAAEVQTLLDDPATPEEAIEHLEDAQTALEEAAAAAGGNDEEALSALKKTSAAAEAGDTEGFFDAIRDAADALEEARDENADTDAIAQVLSDLARHIASEKRDEIYACEPNPTGKMADDVEDGDKDLAAGDEESGEAYFGDAIKDYKKAWESYCEALERCVSPKAVFSDQSSVSSDQVLPERFALHQNYPNPFNPSTTIRFDLVEAGHVELKIYNSAGQLVHTLVSGDYAPGAHKAVWDARDDSGRGVASGVYLAKLQAGGAVIRKKLVLMR